MRLAGFWQKNGTIPALNARRRRKSRHRGAQARSNSFDAAVREWFVKFSAGRVPAHAAIATAFDSLAITNRTTGGRSGCQGALAKKARMAFDFGKFWFKGRKAGTGQSIIKAYDGRLCDLIHHDKVQPSLSSRMNCRLIRPLTLISISIIAMRLDQSQSFFILTPPDAIKRLN